MTASNKFKLYTYDEASEEAMKLLDMYTLEDLLTDLDLDDKRVLTYLIYEGFINPEDVYSSIFNPDKKGLLSV